MIKIRVNNHNFAYFIIINIYKISKTQNQKSPTTVRLPSLKESFFENKPTNLSLQELKKYDFLSFQL